MIEELGGSDLLAYRELARAGARGDSAPPGPPGGVRCGRPLIYPIPAEELSTPLRRRSESFGGSYLGALFAFDLDALPAGQRYTAARFDVALADTHAAAVRLDGDGDTLGVTYDDDPATSVAAYTIAAARGRPGLLRRLAGRADVPRAWVTGSQSPKFGWVYDDPRGELLLPRSYGMHAVIEVPPGTDEVRGTLGVQVEIATGRGRRTRQVAGLRESLTFAEPLTPVSAPVGAAVRLCMAADVSGYSRRINAETERIQSELVDLLSRARRAAGIADPAVRPQPQGDGQFTVLPVGIDESKVIPLMLAELGAGLRELNAAETADPLRMRVALHRGLIKEGRNGWIGAAPIAVHRILDSPPLRDALSAHRAADFVLGVPDVLYRDVFVHAVLPPRQDQFTEMTVELPEKGFIEHCWLHVGEPNGR